ncbi:MAG: DUF4230 domain-containing protein [Niabella sp.]
MQKRTYFFVGILVLMIAALSYLIGKRDGTVTHDHFTTNASFIAEIAELSSLEVQGTAAIKSSNVTNDGSIGDAFKKLFLEKTININVPYVAKYGVNLGKQQINIAEKDSTVLVVLPTPQLLSYELRLDKADAVTRSGLLEGSDNEHFVRVQQKLYAQSRAQLEKNTGYIDQCKQKITRVIGDYYAPMQYKVDVVFKDEIKSRVEDVRQ